MTAAIITCAWYVSVLIYMMQEDSMINLLGFTEKCIKCMSQNISFCYFKNKWFCRECGCEWKDK